MKIGLYCTSISGNDSQTAAFIQELKASQFNTVVIWTLFVHDDGSIWWNGSPLVQNGQLQVDWLPALIEEIKTPPTTVETVLFSIGAGGSANQPNLTWLRINTLLSDPTTAPGLTANFQALAASVPVDGFDFDDEDYYEQFAVTQTAEIFNTPNPRIITFCPYTNTSFWSGCLPPVYTWAQQQVPARGQPVQWMNLQCYAGSNSDAPDLVNTFATSISGTTGTGVGGFYEAQEFIVPGLTVGNSYYTYSPYDIQSTFQTVSGVGGGWLWNSSLIQQGNYTLYDYAVAIINGLNGSSAQEGAAQDGAAREGAAQEGAAPVTAARPPRKRPAG